MNLGAALGLMRLKHGDTRRKGITFTPRCPIHHLVLRRTRNGEFEDVCPRCF
jgi:hypothetical protein